MKVSISGTREALSERQREFVRRRILALPAGTTVNTGGCLGVDAFVARVAFSSGYLRVHTIMPGDRRQSDPLWREFCHSFEEMPSYTTFKQRDVAVVEAGDNLLAFPMYREWVHKTRTGDPRSTRSGTWMTVRLARQDGKPVEVFVLSELPADWSDG